MYLNVYFKMYLHRLNSFENLLYSTQSAYLWTGVPSGVVLCIEPIFYSGYCFLKISSISKVSFFPSYWPFLKISYSVP